MSTQPSIPSRHAVSDYVEDGAYIAAILFVGGIIGVFVAFAASSIGGHGSVFRTVGPQIGASFVLVGTLNALLFGVYRAIDYWNRYVYAPSPDRSTSEVDQPY